LPVVAAFALRSTSIITLSLKCPRKIGLGVPRETIAVPW
jgi:hypothetical protein